MIASTRFAPAPSRGFLSTRSTKPEESSAVRWIKAPIMRNERPPLREVGQQTRESRCGPAAMAFPGVRAAARRSGCSVRARTAAGAPSHSHSHSHYTTERMVWAVVADFDQDELLSRGAHILAEPAWATRAARNSTRNRLWGRGTSSFRLPAWRLDARMHQRTVRRPLPLRAVCQPPPRQAATPATADGIGVDRHPGAFAEVETLRKD